jgi:DNA-binding MarR family transcriptional regulator
VKLHTSDFNKTFAPWLGRTTKMMNLYFQDIFQKHNIQVTKEQWIVLKILHEDNDGLVQNELAFITDRNKASLTRLIHVMEKNELVFRQQSEIDSRKNRIFITKKGKDLFIKMKPLILENILKLQQNISKIEMEQLIATMKKIQTNLSNQTL